MRSPQPAPGIAAELARTKAALASAQDTIAWQRAEIDRLTDRISRAVAALDEAPDVALVTEPSRKQALAVQQANPQLSL